MSESVDALYRESPRDFVRARNALAKTLRGGDAARVRALPKPTVPAWAINQLYWRDRPVFDRLVAAGTSLRRAELAVLAGRPSDLRNATASQRAALADAIRRTIALARDAGVTLESGAIAGTLEALSLSPEGVEPGRLTRPLRPAGFEALAGARIAAPVTPTPHHRPEAPSAPAHARADGRSGKDADRADAPRGAARRAAAERKAAKREAAAQKAAARREAAERRALDRAIAVAERAEAQAAGEETRAREALAKARQKLAELRHRQSLIPRSPNP